MKITAIVLSIFLALSIGFIFGRSQGVQVVQSVFSNDCEKLGGFAIGSKVYSCSRVKKEKKVD